MTLNKSLFNKLLEQEQLNFWLTNRIPRILLTRMMGRLSKIRHPWIARPGIALWRHWGGLDLREAQQSKFDSIHECFIRRLKPGTRPFDPDADIVCSPCDALVGAQGLIQDGQLIQIKGMVYRLSDLLQSESLAKACEGYGFVTLRLTASMYHHFHAPHDLRVKSLRYIRGDAWNVNPPTLKRVPSLFTKNERAVIELSIENTKETMWLIPVAAVLVASMRFTFSNLHLHLNYHGPSQINTDVPLRKGDEMGWFEHGSTIICLTPPEWRWMGPSNGQRIKAGQALWHRVQEND